MFPLFLSGSSFHSFVNVCQRVSCANHRLRFTVIAEVKYPIEMSPIPPLGRCRVGHRSSDRNAIFSKDGHREKAVDNEGHLKRCWLHGYIMLL